MQSVDTKTNNGMRTVTDMKVDIESIRKATTVIAGNKKF